MTTTTTTRPAPTDKQVAFLTKLLAERPSFSCPDLAGMDRRICSALIDTLLALPRESAPAKATPAAQAHAVVADSFYLHAGTVYRTQARKDGRGVYALRLQLPQGRGRAQWVYEGRVADTFTADDLLTIEQAVAFGHTHGFCARCGIRLDDPISATRGLGDTCARKMGMDVSMGAKRAMMAAAGLPMPTKAPKAQLAAIDGPLPTPAPAAAHGGLCWRHGNLLNQRGSCWECECEAAEQDREDEYGF